MNNTVDFDNYRKNIQEIWEAIGKIEACISIIESKLGIDNNNEASKQELDEAYSDGYREGYESAKYSPAYYNNVYSKFIEDCNNNVNSTQAFNPYK